MIITRSPLRVTLGGGGTDLPSYYRHNGGGFLISAAIDKYVYITIHEGFSPELILKYSKMERVKNVADVQHPIIREALRLAGIVQPTLEITSMADIPAGTGLGSSGSFTTALLKALHAYQRNIVHPNELAGQACEIEINRLGEPIGKQDQYIAAYGGVTCFRFLADESVEAWPLRISPETLHSLEDNLILFFTGIVRSAGAILKEQDEKSRQSDREMLENLDSIKQLAMESREALEQGDLRRFAGLMNLHWERKRARSLAMSNGRINQLYELARNCGALGGKLIGAGGGGFLMFYTEDKTSVRNAMTRAGLREIRFRFDFDGTKVLVQ
jgi:D-glycero-alpha-D-manno-heptose-7-phosphate kinase